MARKRSLITLPLLSITDQSLTLRDLKILGALEYFCDRATGISSPERHELSSLTGIRQEHVSKITTNLVKSGWIEKQGRGCRSNPTTYTLLWIIKEGENQPSKGATDGTQSDAERVLLTAPIQTAKGATDGTQSTAKGATDGTQSTAKGAADGTQSGDQRVHTHANSKYINIYTNNRSDRSDPTRMGEPKISNFGFTEAIEILISFGTPKNFFREQEDRQIITSWIEAGVDAHWLTEVCRTAVKRKPKGTGPIGPKYVNLVMTTMAEEVKGETGQQITGTDYRAGTW